MKSTTSFGIFPILITGFALYYLVDTWGGRFETVGYGFLCATFVFILSALLFIRTLRAEGSLYEKIVAWVISRPTVLHSNRSAIAMAGFLIIYAALMPIVGFTLVTAFVFVGLLVLMGWRQPVRLLLYTAGLTLLSHLTLIEILNVPLPHGTLNLFGQDGG